MTERRGRGHGDEAGRSRIGRLVGGASGMAAVPRSRASSARWPRSLDAALTAVRGQRDPSNRPANSTPSSKSTRARDRCPVTRLLRPMLPETRAVATANAPRSAKLVRAGGSTSADGGGIDAVSATTAVSSSSGSSPAAAPLAQLRAVVGVRPRRARALAHPRNERLTSLPIIRPPEHGAQPLLT
jgi:hypothetical protein